MKPFLILILLLIVLDGHAQNNPSKDPFAAKFISYFNADKTDSLYNLFDVELKKSVTLNQIDQLSHQLKSIYGNLTKSEYLQQEKGSYGYLISFERSTMVLNLVYNDDNKIIGFFIIPNPHQQPDLPGTITVKTATSVLKGTLSVPDNAHKVPVVLLIAGSGPTDRNGNSTLVAGRLNYFSQISDALKQNNIAVLRYDKRWVGQSISTKKPSETVFEDYIDDAAAFIRLLKTDNRFSKIIVAGHSEGSLVGMIASECEKADAFISISGLGFAAGANLKIQLKKAFPANDYKASVLIIDSIKAGFTIKQKLTSYEDTLFNPSLQLFLHSLMQYDPQQEIKKLKMPVLIVQGTHDIQVSIENAMLLKKANPTAQLKLVPNMSHILKEGPLDRELNAATYNKNDLPLHPMLIPTLTNFINSIK